VAVCYKGSQRIENSTGILSFGCLFFSGGNMSDAVETMGVEAAAKFLQITKWRVYQLTQKNKIPFHRATGHAGRKLVFIKSELVDFLRGEKKSKANKSK
jgi:excisionase family DNA binding protein